MCVCVRKFHINWLQVSWIRPMNWWRSYQKATSPFCKLQICACWGMTLHSCRYRVWAGVRVGQKVPRCVWGECDFYVNWLHVSRIRPMHWRLNDDFDINQRRRRLTRNICTPWTLKTCRFVFDYNSDVTCSIFITLVLVERGRNNLQCTYLMAWWRYNSVTVHVTNVYFIQLVHTIKYVEFEDNLKIFYKKPENVKVFPLEDWQKNFLPKNWKIRTLDDFLWKLRTTSSIERTVMTDLCGVYAWF